MIYPDSPFTKLQIIFCETAKFTYTHTGSEQNNEFIIVFGISFILSNEVHPYFLLLVCQCYPLL